METIKITPEQERALNDVKNKDHVINVMALNKNPSHPLAGLEISQVAKLLYGLAHYEVLKSDRTFKEGDFVVNDDGTPILKDVMIGKYEGSNVASLHFLEGIVNAFLGPKFRLATEEEVFWYRSMKRSRINGYQNGDIVLDGDGRVYRVEDAEEWISSTGIKGIYPAESFVAYRKDD